MLSDAINKALRSVALDPELYHVMDYAVLPAGKMFRPKLVEAMALDLSQEVSQHHLHLASAIELHHAYTLVHDDLPAMDNDLMRRGKPSTHAAFGEWKAILAGDALLIASFAELMKMGHFRAKDIHHLFTWATGAKGLILGQFLDLKAQGKVTLKDTIRIHELKTARLIQVATVGAYLISADVTDLRKTIHFLRLGREIGVSFQLLDDLNELTDESVSDHERDINPFLLAPQDALRELKNSVSRLHGIVLRHDLKHVERMMREYFEKNQENVLKNFSILETHLDPKIHGNLREWMLQLFN